MYHYYTATQRACVVAWSAGVVSKALQRRPDGLACLDMAVHPSLRDCPRSCELLSWLVRPIWAALRGAVVTGGCRYWGLSLLTNDSSSLTAPTPTPITHSVCVFVCMRMFCVCVSVCVFLLHRQWWVCFFDIVKALSP